MSPVKFLAGLLATLLAKLGVTDLRDAMERCAEHQRERGRL